MNKACRIIAIFLMMVALATDLSAQGMKMGEVLIISNPGFKTAMKPDDFAAFINDEVKPAWKPSVSLHLFQADRGDKKGEFILVCDANKISDRPTLPEGNPFKSSLYTEYQLIGANKLKSRPMAGILGIHYIRVKPELSAEFEKFVTDKLHPVVGSLLPDMQLMYYKAVNGEQAGSYLCIFTIGSAAARDKYWPAGDPETEVLKQSFRPLKPLASELGNFLVEDSYLKPESGGAAAFFESRKWTDYIYQEIPGVKK